MELTTPRLLLNSFRVEEAAIVATLAGDKRVVEMTASIPYPYTEQMAVDWIKSHQKELHEHNNNIFAIRIAETSQLIGCINIGINETHQRGYLGYWIGHDFWGQGFCTEALIRVIRFGFEEKKLNKLWAEHKSHNIASARVMEKAGMKHEGIMRKHYKQEDRYLDMSVKSILREEFKKENY